MLRTVCENCANYRIRFPYAVAAMPCQPRLELVGKANSTAAIVKVIPSPNQLDCIGGDSNNHTVRYRNSSVNDYNEIVRVKNVSHNQMLSSLQPETHYHAFVEAKNRAGKSDSAVINFTTASMPSEY